MIGNITLAAFLLNIVIGFAAQMIDGTLGMAYGVSCRTFLKTAAGLPAAMASAVVHCSEVFTTLASGISHLKLKNVAMKFLWKLMIPGVVGGVLGAWFLSSIGDVLEPFIDGYLVVMGIVIFLKVFKSREKSRAGSAGRSTRLALSAVFWTPRAAAAGAPWSPAPCWPRTTTRKRPSEP